MGKLPKFYNENLIVGIETSDDAAVYRINDSTAMIQTLDFFTPVVDDPYTFGQIAAANSLSDVYAMGGEPAVALNIVGFPNCLDPSVLEEILAGGASKVMEAGAVLAGGHTIQDDEPKYGLSVTGFVHPDRVWSNTGARPGDVLILTKPLGAGIVTTAIKAEMAEEMSVKEVIASMCSLNRKAKQVLEKYRIHACTDVTGFGLAGHSLEMARGSGVTLEIDRKNLPVIQGADALARMGLVPAGAYRNRSFAEKEMDVSKAEDHEIDLIMDPQTSGGLLASVSEKDADAVMRELESAGLETSFAVIGRVLPKQEKYVVLR